MSNTVAFQDSNSQTAKVVDRQAGVVDLVVGPPLLMLLRDAVEQCFL